MNERVQKIIFFLFSMLVLFLIYVWAMHLRESDSSYARFPTHIDEFR